MKNPLVSIGTLSYNSAAFINETIRSVLSQTYLNWEYIICDDCSTDNTVEIIKSYKDPRIKLFVNEKNMGYYENGKRLYNYLGGSFIKILDHDDVLYADCIERQLDILLNNPDAAIVTCDADFINAAGKKMYVNKIPFKADAVTRKQVIDCMFRTARNSFIDGSRTMLRREVLGRDFLLNVDEKLYIIHEPLCAYRLLPTSLQMNISCIKEFQEGYKSLYLNKSLKISRLQYINVCVVNFINYFFRCLIKVLFNIWK
ncbi:MAG: glycosyltransferase [Spirochaetaceae bacterium]|jgi:glycosyltransferase involved in cell wall biosynthesis|nr:glycosyltransferase [Spirochaetaceae bacterium]